MSIFRAALVAALFCLSAASANSCVCDSLQPASVVDNNGCLVGGGADFSPAPASANPAASARAQRVLYIVYDGTNAWYDKLWQTNLPGILTVAAKQHQPDAVVDVSVVSAAGITGPALSTQTLASYDQIWVADPSSGADNSAFHAQVAALVGEWFQVTRGKVPHVIADGHMFSEIWHFNDPFNFGGTEQGMVSTFSGASRQPFINTAAAWPANSLRGTNPPVEDDPAYAAFHFPAAANTDIKRRRPNQNMIINYFNQLRQRGLGGLVLLTDHDAFHAQGMNQVMAACGFNGFIGNFDVAPYAMEVDVGSPLFSWPTISSYEPQLLPGRTCVSRFLWDDSSTGVSPVNQQPNGVVLHPAAWHGIGLALPGISTTIVGLRGFVIDAVAPACPLTYVESNSAVSVNVSAIVIDVFQGATIVSWQWSVVGGPVLCNAQTCLASLSLPVGEHRLHVRATDSQNRIAEDEVCVVVSPVGGPSSDLLVAACSCQNAFLSSSSNSLTLSFEESGSASCGL